MVYGCGKYMSDAIKMVINCMKVCLLQQLTSSTGFFRPLALSLSVFGTYQQAFET